MDGFYGGVCKLKGHSPSSTLLYKGHLDGQLRVIVRKKQDYVGKIPKWRALPPPLPPPQFGKPLLSKKKLVFFFILEPQEHFWSSPKNHNFWVVNVDSLLLGAIVLIGMKYEL